MPLSTNTLYYGDNLGILRDYIPDASPPTRDMKTEAAAAGHWHSDRWGKDYPRIQSSPSLTSSTASASTCRLRRPPSPKPRLSKSKPNSRAWRCRCGRLWWEALTSMVPRA
ncbi:MAG: hypothetical protein HYX50_03050 [Chloroflexi bacterium]|nr:hypothetical protein [Chloroflexota bacterium]